MVSRHVTFDQIMLISLSYVRFLVIGHFLDYSEGRLIVITQQIVFCNTGQSLIPKPLHVEKWVSSSIILEGFRTVLFFLRKIF